jgi:hypothetical protein
MFAGHYAAAFAAKACDTRLRLGLLFLAAQALDVMWASLVLAHIEHMRITPGFTASNPFDFYFMPYSHSLLAAMLWSLAVLLLSLPFLKLRGALWMAAVVASHWFLDLAVHAPDLTLAGGNTKFGFALWNHAIVGTATEFLLLMATAWWYARRTRPRSLGGKFGAAGLVVMLMFVHLAVFFGPPLPSPAALTALALFGYFFFAACAGWVDARRKSREHLHG